jgi:hypothetical protein
MIASEKRRYLRYDFTQLIEYIIHPHTSHEVLKGVVYDISYSGLCLGTNYLLAEGQKIMIKSILPADSKTAVVRWSKNIGENFFKIGLELLQDSAQRAI